MICCCRINTLLFCVALCLFSNNVNQNMLTVTSSLSFVNYFVYVVKRIRIIYVSLSLPTGTAGASHNEQITSREQPRVTLSHCSLFEITTRVRQQTALSFFWHSLSLQIIIIAVSNRTR